MVSEATADLAPLFVLLAVLLFAALGWCMISSCLGQSIADVWNAFIASARSDGSSPPWRRRRDWVDTPMEYEMEYRGSRRSA